MKKIVALVLAMVMVMGLATMASAAMVTDPDLEVVYDTNFDAKLVLADAAEDEEFATYELVLYAKKTGAEYDGKEYDKGDDVTVDGEWVIVDKADAEFAVVDGKKVTYLADAEDYEDGWAEKAQKVLMPYAAPAKMDCGSYYAASEFAPVFYLYDGVFYKAVASEDFDEDEGYVFNVDGVAVLGMPANVGATGTDIILVAHDYNVDLVPDAKGGVDKVSAVWCNYSGVKETFEFKTLKTDAIAAWGPFGFIAVEFAAEGSDGVVYVKWDEPTNYTVIGGSSVGAAAPADKTETVESAKTFDAGIAMYVGMSVMAAAGSAVVLKKKD